MKWYVKLLILVMVWLVWVYLGNFNPSRLSSKSMLYFAVLVCSSVVFYTYNHKYKWLTRILLLVMMCPFLLIMTLALSHGIMIDKYGNPDIVSWSHREHVGFRYFTVLLFFGVAILPLEMAYWSYRCEKVKRERNK